MSQLIDIFGQPANVGDKIAAGMSLGQSSVLRIGEITALSNKTGKQWSISVKWTHNGENDYKWAVKKSTILVRDNFSYAKFVILPDSYVERFPPDIKEDEDA